MSLQLVSAFPARDLCNWRFFWTYVEPVLPAPWIVEGIEFVEVWEGNGTIFPTRDLADELRDLPVGCGA
jgi:hypothetical protein